MMAAVRIKRVTAPLGSHPCLRLGTQYIERETEGGLIEQWKLVRVDPERHLLTYERMGERPLFG